MWSKPDPDPGGEGPTTSSQEITELKDQNEQQQVLIAQLKEMLRKEQSKVSQEKVEEYMNTLSKMNAKKPRVKKVEVDKAERVSSSTGIESFQSEKVNLLKRQLEENKAKLAERGIRQKGIEDMVSTLKAQLNDSHQQITTTSLIHPIVDKGLEYNKTSSQEELYNILLVKEKKIGDLLEKNQKNEAMILDLQENVKEKDSVIDARTKAITLMTESLSKKGKDTLDALDDTKDQMRKMQEQFVQLEAEMKARQMKLLDDLKSKNLEIVKLQESIHILNEEKIEYQKHNCEKNDNEGLEKVIKDLQEQLNHTNSLNEKHLATISDLNKELQESREAVETLTKSDIGLEMVENPNSSREIVKLKKQLDESNKNMIKMKAQSKSKIKDLTKKIDAFKKISDANALVVQLQNEVTRLNEKIAELEEEKGNMQLKMVESTESTQEGSNIIEENSKILEEKDKVISFLESDILALKEEINQLNEKVSNSEKVQVTSEMNSIQIEEDIDRIEGENKKLQETVEILKNEKHLLELKMEEVLKEKHDLNIKLDNYIQENMDLIDKLEKLSAEKVSSAESIEMVEALTPQERLELAAYQRAEGGAHAHEAPPEDDSADLLDAERFEVMSRLEALQEENGRLVARVREVEDHRDTLAETYERLQTENERLTLQVAERVSERDDAELSAELEALQTEYKKLKEENEHLKHTLKEFDTKIHEKDNLEFQLIESKSKIEKLEANLNADLEEISNYKMIIKENKDEFINSSNIINSLQSLLDERNNDIKELNILINDLNNVVRDLQTANEKLGNFETLENQVDELKAALNEQMEDAEAQAKEYREEIARTEAFYEQKLQGNYKEIERLTEAIMEKDSLTKSLKKEIQDKEEKINNVIEDMKQKYLSLQKQLDSNDSSLKDKVEELSAKNKEQLEKMKKIAANLKKKTQAYQELEEKYHGEKEKWETELNQKETSSGIILSQLEATKEDLAKNTAKLEELTDMVGSLDQQRTELQNTLMEMKHDRDKLSEVSLSRELSTSLHEEFDAPLPESANEDKIKELELIVETNESELIHYKERSQKLEQDISRLLEEKEVLERRHLELEDMLSLTLKTVEEKSIMERELGQKLQEASANDKKFEEATAENKELVEKNREQEDLIYKLKVKIKKSQERLNQLKALQSNNEELEAANEKLKRDLAQTENAQKQSQEECEALQRKYERDFERIESEYQVQMEELLQKKNELTVECEKLQESLGNLREREESLLGEISEYKFALEKQNQDANQTSCKEIEDLKQQIEDLQKQIVVQIAEGAIDNVLVEAKHRVFSVNTKDTQTDNVMEVISKVHENKQESTPVFHWPTGTGDSHEFFQQVSQQSSQPAFEQARVSMEGLVNTQNVAAPLHHSDLEAQILSSVDIADAAKDLNTLQEIEFEKCNPCVGEQNVAVVEELIQPKEAYICHQDDKEVEVETEVTKEQLVSKIKALELLLYNVDKERDEILGVCSGMLSELARLAYEKMSQKPEDEAPIEPQLALDLESQVLSPQNIVDISSDLKSLQQIEFTRCDPSLGQQSVQVEEVMQPKKAYLTYQGSSEAFAENDDGWVWGSEEAKLEEEHLHLVDGTPQIQALRDDIRRLDEQVRVLQVDRENHLEEIKQLQVKSGKLIKKCKELKQKNDQLMQKSGKSMESSGFFDLDQTIIEELKAQIAALEKKIEETKNELDKERAEKSNYLKKLESLNSANEKLVEAKEIQNSEILLWKRKYEEIEEKAQQSEWSNDGFAVTPKSHTPKQTEETGGDNIEELQRMVTELSMDNEELQTLLNEQRQQRLDAEKLKRTSRSEEEFVKMSQGNEERIKNLLQKISELETDLAEKEGMITKLQEDLLKLNQDSEERVRSLEQLMSEIEISLTDKEEVNTKLQAEIKEKLVHLQNLEESFRNLNEVNHQLESALSELKQNSESNHAQRVSELEALLAEKTSVADQLKVDYDESIKSNESLILRLESLSTEMEDAKQKYGETESKLNEQLRPECTNPMVQQLTHHQVNSILELVELFHTTRADFEKLSTSYEELFSTNNSLSEKIHELEQELLRQTQQYNDLQTSSAKNILDLQTDLEEIKQKRDQLEQESSTKIKELEKSLTEEKQRYQDLQFETQVLETQKTSDNSSEVIEQQVSQLEALLAERDGNITELKNMSEDLHNQRAIVDEEMKELKNALNEKQMELDNIAAEMDKKLLDTITELEQKWQTVVDERGNTVAESWKYHLGVVESEFSRVQEQLKNRIDELEEKCLALVNENNELRKNVDTEIKNEVDRMSALQGQLTERQHAITELNKIISVVESEKTELIQQVAQLQSEKVELEQILSQKEVELSSSKVIIETTQKQFDEKREVVEEIVKILESKSSWPISCEKEDVLTEFQRQLKQIHEKEEEIARLNSRMIDFQSDLHILQDKDIEIVRLNELVKSLQVEKDQEIFRLQQTVEHLQNQMSLLQQNEQEIIKLNDLIGQFKNQDVQHQQKVQTLQQECEEFKYVVEDYKKKLEEFKLTHIALQNSLEEKNQQISYLNQQLQLSDNHKNDNNKEMERLESELSSVKQDHYSLQQSMSECQQHLFSLTQDLGNKSHRLESCNQQLSLARQNSEILETELAQLKGLLHAKEQEYATAIETMRQSQLSDLQNYYEEIVSAKDIDLQTARAQLEEAIANNEEVIEKERSAIQQVLSEKQQLEEKVNEQAALLGEEDKQLSEMRDIIQEQVVKIEELKGELLEKSKDYDSLIAEMDMNRRAVTQQPTSSMAENRPTQSAHGPSAQDNTSEPAILAELDLALYMLHQRDVRCEELTVELTQLLEERDTLQLKLSNALREREGIRRAGDVVPGAETSPSRSSLGFEAASGVEVGAEQIAAAAGTTGSDQDLASKLSELRRVGYKKDKTFVDEQELRRFQQMSIMQQHISDAARLPAEAAAKLVDANYTLSRDVQSPSKVLLNWLWGRSTPKVNDS